MEFYGPQRVLAQRVLGLRPVPIARFGFGLTAGFPVWHAPRFARRALAVGVGVLRPPRRSRRAAVLMVPCDRYALHTRIESAIAHLEEL